MEVILSWAILTLAVWVTAAILPGFHVKDAKGALLVAGIFGLLSFVLGKLLFWLFAIATLGLAWLLGFLTKWLINALLLVITDKLTDRLKIDSFGWALLGALLIALVEAVTGWMVRAVF
jgi:putative membrane protein